MKIAIIGAGMAGLSCATKLKAHGHAVVLHDKGRGAGGRMSTRRSDSIIGETSFDHGAQYFTAASPEFTKQCRMWLDTGVVAKWAVAGADALVGTPGMNAPIKAMAKGLDVHWVSRVEMIARSDAKWRLGGGDDADVYDAVIIAVPAEQAGTLLKPWDEAMALAADAVVSEPSWTVMLAFDDTLNIRPDIVNESAAIVWAARNNSKPGRGPVESWVLQASTDWTRAHLEEEPEEIIAKLSQEFAKAATITLPEPIIAMAHRWRYAQPESAAEPVITWNAGIKIGICGDWLLGRNVEDAWVSGYRLAEQIA